MRALRCFWLAGGYWTASWAAVAPLEFPPAAPAPTPPPQAVISTAAPASAPGLSPNITANTAEAPVIASPVVLSESQVAEFRDYLVQAWRESRIPGMGVAIVQPGKILFAECHGLRSANGGNITPDTRFALGPASQAVNSLLLARLAELSFLDLDAPARRCWDDFKFADLRAGRIATLRQLLSMTAGIPGQADQVLDKAQAGPDFLFTALAQLPTIAQPGETFQFSAASAAAAGFLAVYGTNHQHAPAIGLAAGYSALAKSRLFVPAGMTTATFEAPAADSANDAAGHVRTMSGRWEAAPALPTPAALLPARGLRASTRDVAAWLQLELSGGVLPDGTRLVGEREVYERWEPVKARNAERYGVGWLQQYYQGRELLARAGEEDNQAALVVIVPQYRTALAVLLNGGGKESAALLQDMMLNFCDFLRETAHDKKN